MARRTGRRHAGDGGARARPGSRSPSTPTSTTRPPRRTASRRRRCSGWTPRPVFKTLLADVDGRLVVAHRAGLGPARPQGAGRRRRRQAGARWPTPRWPSAATGLRRRRDLPARPEEATAHRAGRLGAGARDRLRQRGQARPRPRARPRTTWSACSTPSWRPSAEADSQGGRRLLQGQPDQAVPGVAVGPGTRTEGSQRREVVGGLLGSGSSSSLAMVCRIALPQSPSKSRRRSPGSHRRAGRRP